MFFAYLMFGFVVAASVAICGQAHKMFFMSFWAERRRGACRLPRPSAPRGQRLSTTIPRLLLAPEVALVYAEGMKKTLMPAMLAVVAQVSLADTPKVDVREVRRVFDDGHHNAFTNLAVFEGASYLAFRSCPDGHGVSPKARVIILASGDTRQWKQVHQFSVPGRDPRDPHFLVFGDRLFVYTGTWYCGEGPAKSNDDLDLNLHLGYAVWSKDGAEWSQPTFLEGTFGHYVWCAAAYGQKAFLCGRRKVGFEVGPKGEPNEVESVMLESHDGLIWRKRATFQEVGGDETAFLFERDGGILGIGRRRGPAQLLRSEPPYTRWERRELDRHIGGPLVARWGGRAVVGGRHSTSRGPKTSMCWLVGDELHEFAELPSGGDNAYPGFVAISPTHALISWYSSHEGKASIYTAQLEVRTDRTGLSLEQAQALRLGDTLLSYQRANGAFPKGKDYDRAIGPSGRLKNLFERDRQDTTLDNGATHREIRRLAQAYTETRLPRFRHGCEAGIEFILEAQYENGGWPQRYPDRRGYSRYITFNDGAMAGALTVLRDVANGAKPYTWAEEKLCHRAAKAVARGVKCILNCQIVVDGKRTVWGQQHDEVTYQPRPARAFEPAALCSHESVGVIEFLMSLDAPSPEVIASIEAAVAWLDGPARLKGSELDAETMKRIFGQANVSSMWSRLYEVGTNRPVFGDRDGKVYYAMAEISRERQLGYSWYLDSPRELLEEAYPAWQRRIGR